MDSFLWFRLDFLTHVNLITNRYAFGILPSSPRNSTLACSHNSWKPWLFVLVVISVNILLVRWIGKVLKNGKVYKLSKAERETKKHFKWSDMLSFMCRHAYPLQLAAEMNREKPAVATKINFILFTHFNPFQPLLWQNINAQRRSF